MTGALHNEQRGRHQRAAAERENDRVGMQGAQSSELNHAVSKFKAGQAS